MARNFSNVAEETTLSAGINSSATSITVGSNTGYPSVPYTIIIDPGLATEEVCEVTAVVGTTWTVTRGVDGTPASSHDSGATVVHGYSARDLRDIQDHIGDSTGVHGLGASSSVVGTTDTQTMTNKTLTAPTISGGTISGVTFGSGLTFTSPILTTPTIADFTNATHDHTNDAGGGTLADSGGDTWYRFPAAVTLTSAWTTGTSTQDVNGMSITYTAPASWPEGANNIVYNFMCYVSQATQSVTLSFDSDGTEVINLIYNTDDVATDSSLMLAWPGALTTAGVSHTAKVRINASVVTLFERAFWLTLN